MKHPIKLTRKEKLLLQSEGYNPLDFLRIKRTSEQYEFLQRHNGKVITIGREHMC